MIQHSQFKPAWWLPGRHLQTIVPNTFRRCPATPLLRERLELPDGDFVDLDWINNPITKKTAPRKPLVIVLHGLEGSIESRYAAGLMHAIWQRGWRGVLLHHRGCSGVPNRQPNGYHSGQTADLDYFLHQLNTKEPDTPLAAIGYSLGGNVLLKWLGETGNDNLLVTAVAVSVPFNLATCSDEINRGLSRIYQEHLLRKLRESMARKINAGILDFPLDQLKTLKSFRAFDDVLTGPLHGYADAQDYYDKASSRQFLHNIKTPTLLIQAEDDPFMSADVIPAANELSNVSTLEVSKHGGHVGFVAGKWPWRPCYWLEKRIPDWLDKQFSHPMQTTSRQERNAIDNRACSLP